MEQTNARVSEGTKAATTATLALSMLLASLGTNIANIALPTLSQAFSAPFAQVQAVVVAYLTALTVCVVVAGRLGDRFGLKPMLIAGQVVFTSGSLLSAIAPDLWLLVAARAVQGVGAAFLMTLSMALMRQTASGARIGRAMGLLGTMSALGTALGPSLGGFLIPAAGWRSLFWVLVPLALLALVLAFMLPRTAAGTENTPSANLWSMLKQGLLPNLTVNFLVAAVMMTTLVVGPLYLVLGLGLKETLAGIVMSIGPAISILGGVPSGQLVDAWGHGRTLAIGLGLLAAGTLFLAILPNALGLAGYVLSVVVLTPGYQLFQAANNTAALADIPQNLRGSVSGFLGLSRNIGLVAGASVMGAIFAFGVGTQDFAQASSTAIAAGLCLTFLVAAGMMIGAIWIAFRRRAFADE